MYPTEASNPSGGHCCQTYWGLFLRQPREEEVEVANEEMAEGGQSSSFSTFSTTAFSSYGGPTRSFSLLSPPPLSLSLSLSLALSRSLFLALSRLISAQPLFLSHTRFSGLANTHTNPHCHSLALAIPFRLTCLRLYVPTLATLNAGLARDNPRPPPPPSTAAATPRSRPSSYPSLPPHRLPPFLFSPTVLPDSQPANQHASRLNPRST
ncbi:hypothetical protein ALC56_08656 [Trachymyrmex septentrionalis]|uniref:Uncharacterized protein n=1 Tax=Trachymyrmex septentrionalis TaxID=34720 RepID=A0A195F8B9_9HYME|nr:hypothetical protein ALC56_08656 [Trachymyrmex septentrionalis]